MPARSARPYDPVWTTPLSMALIQTPRTRWVDEGLKALANGGPEAVRIEALARALGVSKGGFYWHFDNRDALLDEILDEWERLVIDEVIVQVEAGGGDARAKLRRLFDLASTIRGLSRAELAVRDWARRDPAVARRLRRADNRRMAYLRGLFATWVTDPDDVEARCMIVMSAFVAGRLVAADHEGRTRAQVLDAIWERLLI